ncbi:Protoglobin-domain-containing protein [Jimgerdemannia flammicorona]|uniref:Protoglobin-domain-containing protein n=1 Tax=Jimgerdemannia flammicorona TaxID=994334 RepID=A0A433QIL1_9FUNG|nr:Protoglobin-domain-containing protein [Jimgerdemannia flammicorona]
METPAMEHIERERLYSDSTYRLQYVARFVNFKQEDIDAITTVGKQLVPAIDGIVHSVYEKLFQYDITKQHFLHVNEGYTGPVTKQDMVAESLEALSLDNPQIKMRMHFLNKYLNRILTGTYDDRMFKYLDYCAKIHTVRISFHSNPFRMILSSPQASSLLLFLLSLFAHQDTPDKKSKINVDYIHINALMAVVEEVLIGGTLSLNLDKDLEKQALIGFNKLIWIQNDFYAKYYAKESVAFDLAAYDTKNGSSKKPDANVNAFGQSVLPVLLGAAAGILAYVGAAFLKA